MGRPKGNVEKSYVSIRMADELIDAIEKFSAERGQTRTDTILNALSFYLTSKECLNCGTLNPASGLHCSECGYSLISDDAVKLLLEVLGEIDLNDFIHNPELQDDELVRDFKTLQEAGYKPIIIPTISRTNGHRTVYLIEVGFCTKEGFRVRRSEDFSSGEFGSIVPGSVLASVLKDKEVADGLQNLDKASPEDIAALKEKIKTVGFEREDAAWIDVAEMIDMMERK